MTSLVTGATGFIGRHLVAALTGDRAPVRALYRDESKRTAYLGRDVQTIRGDACDPAVMRDAVDGIELVYHCAAAHSTAPEIDINRTNLASVRCLLSAVGDAGRKARVILLSSLNVLGNASFRNGTEALPRRRTHDLHADLKIEAEELAEKCIADGSDVVILRPGLVYGEGDSNVQKLAQAIYRGKFVFIGSRDNIAPMIHVSDLVSAMRLAGQAPTGISRVFNITDGTATTIGDFATSLANVLDCPVPTRVLPAMLPRLTVLACGLLGRQGPISRGAL